MYTVYILKSLKRTNQYYVGLTEDLERRLQNHNNEDNAGYSKRYAPWEVETYVSFKSRDRAIAFEKYLKFGSGYAFLRKRLVSLNASQNIPAIRLDKPVLRSQTRKQFGEVEWTSNTPGQGH